MTTIPPGIRFYDQASARQYVLVNDPTHPAHGWLCFLDGGHWLTDRVATAEDIAALSEAPMSDLPDPLVPVEVDVSALVVELREKRAARKALEFAKRKSPGLN